MVRLLAPVQVIALADAMPRRYALLVLLGAVAGLRQGEAFGLALDRIDPDVGMITVNQQVVIVDRRPVLAPPKTSASLRDVPMSEFLRDALLAHVEQLGLVGADVLCRTPRGTLFRRDYYNREIWNPALASAELLPDTTFHDLRHTFATTALAEGVPISEVSRWLGHKSMRFSQRLYVIILYGYWIRAEARCRRLAGPGAADYVLADGLPAGFPGPRLPGAGDLLLQLLEEPD